MHSPEKLEAVYEAVLDLPFVTETRERGDLALAYWTTVPSGIADTDLARGELYARMAIDVAKQFDAPMLLCMILRDMVSAGQMTGLEAGFIGVVGTTCKAGGMN